MNSTITSLSFLRRKHSTMSITGLAIAIIAAGCALAGSSAAPSATCTVTVDANDRRGTISPMLMGFNLVYKYEVDPVWADGKLERALKELKCGLLRWPGGTVVSTYHWRQMPGTPIMDLEEYMGHVRAIGAQPLVGVNVHQSFLSGREEEGLDEARSLIEHCVRSNYQVKYWYIDNELYLPKAQPRMTAEQYARAISRYAAVLRAVDPKIEIVANWEVRWSPGWEKIVEMAGKDVDVADFHLYYHARKELSWESWLQDTPMTMIKMKSDQTTYDGRMTYAEMIRNFRAQAKSRGRDLKLAALELNLFKNPAGPLSPFQGALVEAEEFGQFINAGLDLACFWPLHINGNKYRVLYDQQTGELSPNFQMFKMYSDVLGQTALGSQADQPEVRTVAARSLDGKAVTVYLLRKTGETAPLPVTINLENFKPAQVRAKVFNAASLSANVAIVSDLAVKSLTLPRVDLPAHSFTEITLAE
jgi:alpha-L-arabinofuranosidase